MLAVMFMVIRHRSSRCAFSMSFANWVTLNRVPFGVPTIVRNPYQKDTEREPSLENHSSLQLLLLFYSFRGLGFRV